MNMKHRFQGRSPYQAPCSKPVEVLFEVSLLGESVRMRLYIDELENINATAGPENESDFYFDIYEF